MAIRPIENITVNGGAVGEAFGCKIYQMSLTIGHDKNPTSLSLNIVKEDGIYPDFADSGYLGYTHYNVINLDGVSYYMYMIKASSRKSAESKTFTLEFVDGSHILDRVFVGMVNKHTTHPANMSTGTAKFNVPVCCPDCHGDPFANIQTTGKEIWAVRQVSFSNWVPIGNNVDGGFIFVGEEEYTETDCDIGKYSYNLPQLVYAAKQIGVNLDFPNPAYYKHVRRQHTGSLRSVLQSWCAEVNYTFVWESTNLNSRVYFWDLGRNTGYNTQINNISNIAKDKGLLTRGGETPVVLDLSESTSLRETSKNYQVTFYQADNKTANHKREVNYLQHFAGLYIDDIVHSAEMGKSRSKYDHPLSNRNNFTEELQNTYDYAEFCTSMALSKVNKYAADIYNAMRGYYGYLGYEQWIEIPDGVSTIGGKAYKDLKKLLLGYNSSGSNSASKLLTEYWKNIFRLPDDIRDYGLVEPSISNGGIVTSWFEVVMALTPPKYFQEGLARPATKQYESKIASSFAGQYFYNYARPKEGRTCTKSLTYDIKVDYDPKPELIYSPINQNDAWNINRVNKEAPWYDLIGPRYGMQTFLWPQPAFNGTRSVWTKTPIRVVKRKASFGDKTRQDVYSGEGFLTPKGSPMSELTKSSCGVDIFEQFKPMIISMNSALASGKKTTLNKWIKSIFDNLRSRIRNPHSQYCSDDPFNGYKLDLVIVPKPFLVSKFMHVNPVMSVNNDGTYNLNTWQYGNEEEPTYINNIPKEEPEDCTDVCDLQKGWITDSACDCDPSIYSGPGDLSAQTIEFQNELFLPQKNAHAHGLYTNVTYNTTLSFVRNNPWTNFIPHGVRSADTSLNIALPVGTFRPRTSKYLPAVPNSSPIQTAATFGQTEWYRVNFKETISITYKIPKETSVKNNFYETDSQGNVTSLPYNVAKINVQEKDVSSQLDIIDGNCGGSSQLINMYVPDVGFVDLETYHNLYSNLLNTGSEWPRKTVSVTIAGLNLGTLYDYANVIDGLESWTISMSTDGYQTQASWANKPKTYPSAEMHMKAVQPEIMTRLS